MPYKKYKKKGRRAGRRKQASRREKARKQKEGGKGWETLGERKFRVGVIDVLGWWMCVGEGGWRVNPERQAQRPNEKYFPIGQRGLKRLHMTPLSREILKPMPRFRRFYYVTMCVVKSFVLVPLSHLSPYPLYPTSAEGSPLASTFLRFRADELS